MVKSENENRQTTQIPEEAIEDHVLHLNLIPQ